MMTAATGCKSTVPFPTGAPYPYRSKVDDGVIISFPDTLPKRQYKVNVGTLWESHTFIIPVYETYRNETSARMNGLFTKGVTVTGHGSLKEIEAGQEAAKVEEAAKDAPHPADPDSKLDANVTKTELDKILDDISAKDTKERKVKKSEAELTADAIRQAGIDMINQKPNNFIVFFNDAILGMQDKRIIVTFSIKFIDRKSGNTLFEKRYQGRSSPFEPNRSDKTNEGELIQLTKLAFSGAMSTMTEDIAVATGVWEPKQ